MGESSERAKQLEKREQALLKEIRKAIVDRIVSEEDIFTVLSYIDQYSLCPGIPAVYSCACPSKIDGVAPVYQDFNFHQMFGEWPNAKSKGNKYGSLIVSKDCSIFINTNTSTAGNRYIRCSSCQKYHRSFVRHAPIHQNYQKLTTEIKVKYTLSLTLDYI